MTIPNAGKNEEKRGHSHIPDRNVKWYSHSGKFCSSFLKTKHAMTFWPSYGTFRDHYSEVKSHVHTKAYTWMSIEALSATAKNLEATQIFVDRWMVKQTVVLTYHGLSNWKDQTINTCNKLNKSPGDDAAWKSQTQITYIWFYLYNILTTALLRYNS